MVSQVNPRVDLAFKKIFGVEENKDLLISLINSIVSEEDQIKDVQILNPYNLQNFKNDKLSIVDIKADGCNGRRYHIEIQISDEGDYDKRALHNWAKVYTEQLLKAGSYARLDKTIGIHILNFLSIPGVEKYHGVYQLREKETGMHYFTNIELHTIELIKFEEHHKRKKGSSENEELHNLLAKIKTGLDMWVAFLTRHDLLDRAKLPKQIDDPHLKKALHVLEVMNLTPVEREQYDAHLQWLLIEASTVAKAEVRGEAKGEVKGEAKGKATAFGVVVNRMLVKGFDIKTIAEVTGLTEKELHKLYPTQNKVKSDVS